MNTGYAGAYFKHVLLSLIQIWKVLNEQSGIKIIFLSSLSRHTKAVNVVRFSPSGNNDYNSFFRLGKKFFFFFAGEYLASAGDGNEVFILSPLCFQCIIPV